MLRKRLVVLIIVFLAQMLVFTGTVNAIVLNEGNSAEFIKSDVSLPSWSNGDSWTYEGYYKQKFGYLALLSFKVVIEEMVFKVTDSSGDNYTLACDGLVRAGIGVGEGLLTLASGNITGDIIVDKEKLGIDSLDLTFDGAGKIFLLTIMPFNIQEKATFTNPLTPFKFPFDVGQNWTSESSKMSFQTMLTLFGGTDGSSRSMNFPQSDIKCESQGNIDVKAGTYSSYKLVIEDQVDLYYSSTVKNIVKAHMNFARDVIVMNIELKDTSFT